MERGTHLHRWRHVNFTYTYISGDVFAISVVKRYHFGIGQQITLIQSIQFKTRNVFFIFEKVKQMGDRVKSNIHIHWFHSFTWHQTMTFKDAYANYRICAIILVSFGPYLDVFPWRWTWFVIAVVAFLTKKVCCVQVGLFIMHHWFHIFLYLDELTYGLKGFHAAYGRYSSQAVFVLVCYYKHVQTDGLMDIFHCITSPYQTERFPWHFLCRSIKCEIWQPM